MDKAIHGRSNLPALTGVRAIAAGWVLLFHYASGAARFLPPGQSSQFGPLFATGYLGVDLFFILSGFILTYNYAQSLRKFQWFHFAEFIAARLSRIYPVHIFTLFLFLPMVIVARFMHFPLTGDSSFLPGSFVRNLFLVQGWSIPVHTSWNGASWSLSEEWIAYLTFPLLVIVLINRVKSTKVQVGTLFALPVMLAVLCSLQHFPGNASYGSYRIAFAFPLGAILNRLYEKRLPWFDKIARLGILWFGAAFGLSLVFDRLHLPAYLVEIFLAVFLYSLAIGNSLGGKALSTPHFIYAGKLSFAVYMCQELVFMPGDKLVLPVALHHGWPAILAYWIVSFAAILLLSAFTFHFVEEPSRKFIRKPIARLLKRIGRVPHPFTAFS